jgi:hypothetical protein
LRPKPLRTRRPPDETHHVAHPPGSWA